VNGRAQKRFTPHPRRRRWRAGTAAFCLLAATLAPAVAQPVPSGRAQRTVLAGDEAVEVFTYKPADYQRGPLLIVLHGVDRDADRYRDHAIPLADRLGYMVAAPRFDAARFPFWRYQWAGIARRTSAASGVRTVSPARPEQRLDAVLRPLIETLRRADGEPLPYALAGHSAGAQALIRWAAFAVPDAIAIVAANPGAWLLPSRAHDYPYGFGGLPSTDRDEDRLRAFLSLPLTVLLGDRDLGTEGLSTAPEAMQQGANRLERGRHAFDAARLAAGQVGIELGWRLVEVPGVGHSARRMFDTVAAMQALQTRQVPPQAAATDPR
jgi:hypothetical protein